jgi:hypothetical protein
VHGAFELTMRQIELLYTSHDLYLSLALWDKANEESLVKYVSIIDCSMTVFKKYVQTWYQKTFASSLSIFSHISL